MDHTLRFSARTLGPRSKGTDALCACGWEAFTNEKPPSKSKSWQNAVQARHTHQATPEWTLTRLREELDQRIAKLQDAVRRDSMWNIEMYAEGVSRWSKRFAAELKEQADKASREEG